MDYKTTLNLPKTTFPMKANLPEREPAFLARWDSEDLYGLMRRARAGAETFVLHDGPPYANGDIHIGHALNKILKDVIVRYKVLRGYDAPYVPGWDCHGMPIEHQLFKERKLTKRDIAQHEFRGLARAYAERYVGIQREQFKRLGVVGDWARPYLTMSAEYGMTVLRSFKELVRRGYIVRDMKPVYWCATCETALAEAEVEYEDRRDASIYVAFPVERAPAGLPADARDAFGRPTAVVAWTTTPWTLPANVALCFHPDARYAVFTDARWTSQLVVASDVAEAFLAKLGAPGAARVAEFDGRALDGMVCRAPLAARGSRAVFDAGVSLTEGTGVVHIAPGHGHEDFLIGRSAGLEVLSPVDERGRFTQEVPAWAGRTVWDATPDIIRDLTARGLLLREEPLEHSYPHCWRCKQPVIFRATPQWFLRVTDPFRAMLLEAVRGVRWVPDAGLGRIAGMLQSRPDWCLSRQRYWGSPIPVLHCAACERPLLDVAAIERIEAALAERGLEAWFTETPAQLAPGLACPDCGGRELRKDPDILDVWFDSGVSHAAVLRPETWPGLRWPADLYLEGSDQHRGWFQVSLITAAALKGAPPYRQVLTHGFVVDGDGRKMSKSLGNVIAPQEVTARYGADILRLWVASSDYREDVRISDEILEQTAESYRKIRNTFRYLLANLFDFHPRAAVPARQLGELDRWALHRTAALCEDVTRAYEAYQFHDAIRAVYRFCVQDLSSCYLDALKDRLYTEPADSAKRRCAQTALYAILRALVATLAPVLVVTTDEVWQFMREAQWVSEPFAGLGAWTAPEGGALDAAAAARWDTFFAVRGAVMKALEAERLKRVIGSPLEARVTLSARDPELLRDLHAHRDTLAEAFVVSEVAVAAAGPQDADETGVPGLAGIRISRAPGAKCGRCWKHLDSVGAHADHPQLCARCVQAVAGMPTLPGTHATE
ncbi:MAG TPA: isoleucine--tRNA ligase [bacterium]